MEIEVFVDADPFVDEPRERYRAVSAFFTYVSLSKEGKPLPVPQLLVRAPAPLLLLLGHTQPDVLSNRFSSLQLFGRKIRA